MPQILLNVSVYDGSGFEHKSSNKSALISTDQFKKQITQKSIQEAHEILDQLIEDYLEKTGPK